MVKIALLDQNDRLVGTRVVEKPDPDDVVVPDGIDTPMDGTYKYVRPERAFFPLGKGFGRPLAPPISNEEVLYQLARNMDNPPDEIVEWLTWYEAQLMKRNDETRLRQRKLEPNTNYEQPRPSQFSGGGQ